MGARRGQGIVDIGDGQDAGRQRDFFPFQAVRVARPVPALVVRPDNGQDGPGERDAFEDGRADFRVETDLGELLVGQVAALEEDVIGDAELADVFEQGARIHGLDQVGAQAHVAGGGDSGALDADDVLV